MRAEALMLLALIVGIGGTACQQESRATEEHPAAADDWIWGIGRVEPVGEVRQLCFKRQGIIAECQVKIGQQLKKGDVVMRLQDDAERAAVVQTEAAAELARAERDQTLAGVNPARIRAQEAALQGAQAEAANARTNFTRQTNLLANRGAASEADRDNARKEMERTEAMVRQAEAELEHLVKFVRPVDVAALDAKVRLAEAQLAGARTALEETILRAPSSGMVLEILRREGTSSFGLAPEPVVVFADVSELRVRAEIDETYALRAQAGQEVILRSRDPSRTEFKTFCSLVKPAMGNKTLFTRTAQERADLDVLQLFAPLPAGTFLPVGLEMDVGVRVAPPLAADAPASRP